MISRVKCYESCQVLIQAISIFPSIFDAIVSDIKNTKLAFQSKIPDNIQLYKLVC